MQELQLPAEERLLPKVHVNLGITLEADGCLSAACDHYRCVLPLLARIRGVLLTCMHAIKCVACTNLQGGGQAGAKPLQGAQAAGQRAVRAGRPARCAHSAVRCAGTPPGLCRCALRHG